MKFRDITYNITLSILSFVIFLLLAEALLRIGVAVFGQRITKIDPYLGWYHHPNSSCIRTIEEHQYSLSYNSHGFRTPEHPYKNQKENSRIVVLGDSFVDGSEVGDEETFTWHLQKSLDSTEVINLGVYGYSTHQAFLTLQREGLKYSPDLVILFTLPNDFTDNLVSGYLFGPRPRFILEDDSLVFRGVEHPTTQAFFRKTHLPMPGMQFLLANSYLYYVINKHIYQPFVGERLQKFFAAQINAFSQQERVELYIRVVKQMKDICDKNEIEFLVIFVYPKKELLNNSTSPNLEICALLNEDGIQTLDLFGQLRRRVIEGVESIIYYEQDIHWNPEGHKFVSSLLGTWLKNWKYSKESIPSQVKDSTELKFHKTSL